MPEVTLRPANPGDLERLRHWDEQPHTVASDPNDDWGWETELARDPPWREQLIGEVDGRPVGFVQIIDPAEEDSHYWGDVPPNLRAIDIWIGEASDLNRGYGTEMMKQAIARCFAPPEVTAILIDPLARTRPPTGSTNALVSDSSSGGGSARMTASCTGWSGATRRWMIEAGALCANAGSRLMRATRRPTASTSGSVPIRRAEAVRRG